MSFFSGIISGIKAIVGISDSGSGNVMKAATGVGNWIDEQQFTKQEAVEHRAAMIPKFQVFMDNTITENSERSKTRRDIAIWIIRNWFFMLWASIALKCFGKDELAKYIFQVATIDELLWLVGGVGAFFFGAHIIRQMKG